jgi:hypothetical protein
MKTKMTWLLASLLAGSKLVAADIEVTVYPGQTTNNSLSMTLPALPPAADVLFSFDVTGSMGGVIDTAKTNAISLMSALEATGVSFHFGVTSFGDYPATYISCGYSNYDAYSGGVIPYGGSGIDYPGYTNDYPYQLNLAMTTNQTAVTAAISGLALTPGMDGPEAYTRALYESYADTNVAWRSGAKQILVNFGDSVPHDCNLNVGIPGTGGAVASTGGDPGRDGIMGTSDDLVLLDVLHGMASNHVVLLAARVSSYAFEDYYFPYWTNWTTITGGKAFQSTNTSLIKDLMHEITNSLAITCVSNLHPVFEPPDFSSWLISTPTNYARICSGDIRVFNLALTPPLGTPAGDYSFTVHVVDDKEVAYVDKVVLIHVAPPVALPVALNNSDLIWVTAPSLPWFGQTNVAHDGVASSRSYFIGDGQQSTLTTTASGPGTLSFWWKASSQTNADVLSFLSYGGETTNLTAQISGETGWKQLSLFLPGGPQTMVWTYTKDASQKAGLDAGFVDQVSYVPGATLPFIIADPVSQVVSGGTPATFSVLANGTPVLAYQWRHNGADVPGATSSVFNLPVPACGDAGTYSAWVSSPYGTTNSADASLTFPMPSIITNPVSQLISGGSPVTFSVLASGPVGLGYQWCRNGTDVPGATMNVFTLPEPSCDDAGTYWVRVSSLCNSTNSVSASLNFVPLVLRGDNSQGQTELPSAATNLVSAAAGSWHNLGLCANGTVLAWGGNDAGQCNVPAGLNNALAVAGGGYHSLAIQADETVVAWGANDYDQANVPAGLANVIGICAGTWHSVALRRDGTVKAWGDTSWGQSSVPVGLSNVVAIAAGGNHSLALRTNGTVVAWGDNTDAGGNVVGQSVVPIGLTGVVAIAAGDYHSLAVRSDGTVVAWGDDSQGQISVPLGLSNVVAVAGGGAHSLALKADGTMAAWGANWNGQCNLASIPANVVGLASGEVHSLLLSTCSLPSPKLLNPVRTPRTFSFLIQTLDRKHYALDFKTSLAATSWSPICSNAGNGTLELLTDHAATAAQRFYRVRQW